MSPPCIHSPFEVMFGRKPVLPVDLDDKQPRPDLDVSVDTLTTERLRDKSFSRESFL